MIQSSARITHVLPEAKQEPAYFLKRAMASAVQPTSGQQHVYQMRKLKYHVNVSADGYILGRDQGFDAFPGDEKEAQYLQSLHAYGIALMGRGTYEAARSLGIDDPYPHLMSYVFSRAPDMRNNSPIEFVTSDATQWVRRMKGCPGKDLYLCGGAKLAASLFKAGLIDEVILKISPVLAGSGRQLLCGLDGHVALVNTRSVACDDGAVIVTYRVKSSEPLSAVA